MKLFWNPPPKEKQNGAIIGYRVEVNGPDPIYSVNVVDKNAKVDRLRPNTKYIFKVSAKTEAGSGPAATVECITCPGGKIIPYGGKLSGEKTFMNFAVLLPPAKVFFTKFGCAISTYDRF